MKNGYVRVKLSEHEHRALKVHVAQRGTTITKLMRQIIHAELAAAKAEPEKK